MLKVVAVTLAGGDPWDSPDCRTVYFSGQVVSEPRSLKKAMDHMNAIFLKNLSNTDFLGAYICEGKDMVIKKRRSAETKANPDLTEGKSLKKVVYFGD